VDYKELPVVPGGRAGGDGGLVWLRRRRVAKGKRYKAVEGMA